MQAKSKAKPYKEGLALLFAQTSNGVNKTITIAVIALVAVIGGYFIFRGGNQTSQESNTQTPSLGEPVPGFESVPETVVTPIKEGLESFGESANSELAVREINMASGNLFFNPKNLTLVKGQPVRIAFQNTGTHTFTIDELGINVPLSGGSPVVEFTPTKSGTFQYYCAVPGHRGGGMSGSLTIE